MSDHRRNINERLGLPLWVAEELHRIWPKGAFHLARLVRDKAIEKGFCDKRIESVKAGFYTDEEHSKDKPHRQKTFNPIHMRDMHGELCVIRDWLAARAVLPEALRGDINLKTSSLSELVEHSKNWHKSLKIVKRSNKVRSDERDADVFLQFENGWYWVNLKVDRSAEESSEMGHCGTDYGHHIISLRDANSNSHLTLSRHPSTGKAHQFRGQHNSSPSKKYDYYIFKLFEQTVYPITGFNLDKFPIKIMRNYISDLMEVPHVREMIFNSSVFSTDVLACLDLNSLKERHVSRIITRRGTLKSPKRSIEFLRNLLRSNTHVKPWFDWTCVAMDIISDPESTPKDIEVLKDMNWFDPNEDIGGLGQSCGTFMDNLLYEGRFDLIPAFLEIAPDALQKATMTSKFSKGPGSTQLNFEAPTLVSYAQKFELNYGRDSAIVKILKALHMLGDYKTLQLLEDHGGDKFKVHENLLSQLDDNQITMERYLYELNKEMTKILNNPEKHKIDLKKMDFVSKRVAKEFKLLYERIVKIEKLMEVRYNVAYQERPDHSEFLKLQIRSAQKLREEKEALKKKKEEEKAAKVKKLLEDYEGSLSKVSNVNMELIMSVPEIVKEILNKPDVIMEVFNKQKDTVIKTFINALVNNNHSKMKNVIMSYLLSNADTDKKEKVFQMFEIEIRSYFISASRAFKYGYDWNAKTMEYMADIVTGIHVYTTKAGVTYVGNLLGLLCVFENTSDHFVFRVKTHIPHGKKRLIILGYYKDDKLCHDIPIESITRNCRALFKSALFEEVPKEYLEKHSPEPEAYELKVVRLKKPKKTEVV